jgi:hypothetical protein
MVLLTTILLMLIGATLGLARRAWWEIGALTLLACGSLQVVYLLVDDWRGELGLPHHDRLFAPMVVGWLLIGAYASYALALLYARWRLSAGARSGSDR